MRRQLGTCLAAMVGTLLVGTWASAAIILSDNFQRTSGVNAAGNAGGLSSWGSNANPLGGTVTQTYKVRDTAGGTSTEQQFVDGSRGRLRLGHGVVDFDLLSIPAVKNNGFEAAFEFQRGGGGFLALAVGLTPTEIQTHPVNNARIGVPFAANIPQTDFGFLFRPSAASEYWRAGVVTAGPANIFNGPGNNTALARFTPAVQGNWDAGATINFELFLNGALSPQFTTSFVSDGSGLGYFGFHSNAGTTVSQAAIDNLVISSVIPEPSTIALTVGCLALGLIRRLR